MYKVIIADDESSVRERLVTLLSKMTDDFQVIGSFENGFDTLIAGVPLMPDLIITDIKMPYIDGIELIKRAKQEIPLVQSIIISGFDSFDFAKKAIDLGVVGYLTKPITFEELEICLKKVKEELDRKNDFSLDIKALQAQAETALKLVQESDLSKLITLKDISADYEKKLINDGIEINHKFVKIISFDFDDEIDNIAFEKTEYSSLLLNNLLKEELLQLNCLFYIFHVASDINVLLLSDSTIDHKLLEEILARVLAKIKKASCISISCGISEVAERTDENISFRKLYRHARRALEYRTVIGLNLVLFYKDTGKVAHSNAQIDENEYTGISYELLYGKIDEAKRKISKLVNKIASENFKETYFFVINNILDVVLKSCISLPDLYNSYMPHLDIVKTVVGAKTSDQTILNFNLLIDKIDSVNKIGRTDGIDNAFQRIKDFITSNYYKSEISLDDVADELAYSVSYISAIFKRNNTSFTKYLTDVRMQHAMILLSSPDEKVVSVAQKIGYEDAYYFSHCFKKYTGMSPLEFKKK